MNLRKVMIALAVVAALATAAPASAAPMVYGNTGYITPLGPALGLSNVEITRPAQANYIGFAGLLGLSGFDLAYFTAYCVDASIGQGTVEYLVRPLTQLPDGGNPPNEVPLSGQKVAWLLNTYGAGVGADANKAGALQMAIWEVLYDTGGPYNLAAGVFSWVNRASYATALGFANTYLTNVGTTGQAIWLDGIRGGQDYALNNPVPEPGSMLLFGSGLVGLARLARRRRS